MRAKKGLLVAYSGPSGSGKDTVLHKLLAEREDTFLSVSVTTRPPRPGERDGVDYFFITEEEMRRRIAEGGLYEYTTYCGNLYGTPKKEVEEALLRGGNVILEIDTVGGKSVRALSPDAVLIFLTAPSLEEIERRLRARGSDSEEAITARLAAAREEMALIGLYDYIILNRDVGDAVRALHSILDAERMRTSRFASDELRLWSGTSADTDVNKI